jgi:HK97 family phage major capsid protein
MPYNSIISRANADALIPVDIVGEIVKNVVEQSAVMRLAKKLPNMSALQSRIPVMSLLPTAYFLNAGTSHTDTTKKQTTNMEWENVYINAEELAVIVPIPQAVLDDAEYDIWGEVRPALEEAFGAAFDAAVLFGTNAPTAWPVDLLAQIVAAGHDVVSGTGADMYEDVMGVGGVIGLVKAGGFMHNGHIAHVSLRALLRGLRSAVEGIPLFVRSMQESSRYELDGSPILFPMNGSMDAAQALMFTGDWTKLVYSIRQDLTYKILDQAVIQDGTGAIVYNLAQQDMVALRAVMRIGWQLPNPASRMNTDAASRLPFAALVPAAGS